MDDRDGLVGGRETTVEAIEALRGALVMLGRVVMVTEPFLSIRRGLIWVARRMDRWFTRETREGGR